MFEITSRFLELYGFATDAVVVLVRSCELRALSPYIKPWAEAGSLFRWKATLEVTAVRRRWLNFERRNHRPRWEPVIRGVDLTLLERGAVSRSLVGDSA